MVHKRMIHRRKGRKRREKNLKLIKGLNVEEQNTRSEKYKVNSGTVLISRKTAFK